MTPTQQPSVTQKKEWLIKPWAANNVELQKRRVETLSNLGLMLSSIDSAGLEIDGFDTAKLYAEVLMALQVEDSEYPGTALEACAEYQDGDTLVMSEQSTAELRAENERLRSAAMKAADFIGAMPLSMKGQKIYNALDAALDGQATQEYLHGKKKT